MLKSIFEMFFEHMQFLCKNEFLEGISKDDFIFDGLYFVCIFFTNVTIFI